MISSGKRGSGHADALSPSKVVPDSEGTTRLDRGHTHIVSILIPAYKHDFFREALASALAQTYCCKEIVVCDDCPDGRIEETVNDAIKEGVEIRYHRNRPREGPLRNYLQCLELARGDYVKFLNDDDVLDPRCVARMMEALVQWPAARFAVCHRVLIDENGAELKSYNRPRALMPDPALLEARSLARFLLASGVNRVGEPTAMLFRRDLATNVSPHVISFGGIESPGWGDVAMALNFMRQTDVAYLPEKLCAIRIHPGQWQRNPELRRRAVGSLTRLRQRAYELGMRPRRGNGADVAGFMNGLRYRRAGDGEAWRRRRPTLLEWAVFVKRQGLARLLPGSPR